MLLQNLKCFIFLTINNLTTVFKHIQILIHYLSTSAPLSLQLDRDLSRLDSAPFCGEAAIPSKAAVSQSGIFQDSSRYSRRFLSRSPPSRGGHTAPGAELGLLQMSHPTARAFLQEAGGRCWQVWTAPGTLMGTKSWVLAPTSSVIPSLSTSEVTQVAAFCLRAFCSRDIAESSETLNDNDRERYDTTAAESSKGNWQTKLLLQLIFFLKQCT